MIERFRIMCDYCWTRPWVESDEPPGLPPGHIDVFSMEEAFKAGWKILERNAPCPQRITGCDRIGCPICVAWKYQQSGCEDSGPPIVGNETSEVII